MARHKEFDQEKALDNAMHLFWRQGYEATSVRDLIAHTGISSSSMYDTFGDKHAIYLAALRRYRKIEKKQVQQTLNPDLPAKEVLRRWFDLVAEMVLSDANLRGSFSLNAAIDMGTRDKAIAQELIAHFNEISSLLTGYLYAAQTKGDISNNNDPEALAHYFINALYGMFTLLKTYPDRDLVNNIASITLSILD